MKNTLRIVALFILTLILIPGFVWLLFTGKTALALGPSSSDSIIYDDALVNNWQNWSWNSTLDFNATSAPKSGSKTIAAAVQGWGGVYFHNDLAVDPSTSDAIIFSLKPTRDGSNYVVLLYDANNQLIGSQRALTTFGPTPATNVWNTYTVPMPSQQVKGIAIQDVSGQSSTVYLDELYVKSKVLPTATPTLTPTPTSSPQTPTATPTSSIQTPNSGKIVYTDSLASGWENWSWGSAVSLQNTISFTPQTAWAGLYFHTNNSFSSTGYASLQFSLEATQANEKFSIVTIDQSNQITTNPISLDKYAAPTSGTWITYTIPLSDLQATNKQLNGIILQESKGQAQPTVYVDNIAFTSSQTTTVSQPTPTQPSVPSTPPTTKKFYTLPPGSALPSDATCANAIQQSTWEPRPENYTANNTKGATNVAAIDGATSAGNAALAPRIDGNFTGTTDEIIQWGACKWGFDEDIVRAVAAQESWWKQSTLGDWNGSYYESYGLLQVRKTSHVGTYPLSQQSVPYNVDYALAWRRACYEGYFTWIPTSAKGDEWGCVGLWYSGKWYDGDANTAYSGANWYISKVKGYLSSKPWLQAGF